MPRMARRAGLSLVLPLLATAQEPERVFSPNANAWFNYFGDHAVSRRWGLHLEGQWRRNGPFHHWQQLLLRPGVNFYLNPNVMLTAGYGFIRSYPYGDFPALGAAPEHRFWQQVLVRHRPAPRLALQHRFRLEQRNLGVVAVGGDGWARRAGWRYENRFRYFVRADVPLRGQNDRPAWYLALYNEAMVNYGANVGANTFDQNRAYVAVGKAVSRTARLEVGYLNQLVQQRNGRIFEVNHTVMVSLFATRRFRR